MHSDTHTCMLAASQAVWDNLQAGARFLKGSMVADEKCGRRGAGPLTWHTAQGHAPGFHSPVMLLQPQLQL